MGTSTTGQQAWAMTVSDLAPSSADVKAPCSARPSTSRLACRDASTRAPAAPPAAGTLLACTPGADRQRAGDPLVGHRAGLVHGDVPQVLGAGAGPHGHGRVVHGRQHLQRWCAAAPRPRRPSRPPRRRRGSRRTRRRPAWGSAPRAGRSGAGAVGGLVLGSSHAVTVEPADRARAGAKVLRRCPPPARTAPARRLARATQDVHRGTTDRSPGPHTAAVPARGDP